MGGDEKKEYERGIIKVIPGYQEYIDKINNSEQSNVYKKGVSKKMTMKKLL